MLKRLFGRDGGDEPTAARQEGDDRWRIEEGRELGELLRVVRDDDGAPAKLYVATYPLTRAPTPFAGDASA